MRRLGLVIIFCLLVVGAASAQTIETVAGGGPNNMPAVNANLPYSSGVLPDSAGDLYIVSYGLSRVFKVNAQGQLTVLAGNGTPGFSGDSGPATRASLRYPRKVAEDANGNLYIADTDNARVRKVDASGIITTVAGGGDCAGLGDGGPATNACVASPDSVSVDASGNLYIADAAAGRIRKVDPSGTITTVAGGSACCNLGDGGPAASAYLSNPEDVYVDTSGTLYIADSGNDRVRRVDTAGIITTVAGGGPCCVLGDGGPATSVYLDPVAVAVAPSGDIYIGDVNTDRVRKVDGASGIITTVAGNGTDVFSGDNGPAIEAGLNYPWRIALDAGGNLYIADAGNARVRRVDSASGIITTIAGNGTYAYSGDDGPATGASLNNPEGVALDASGDLYISDTYNDRIRKVDASGSITTFAGNGKEGHSGDGGPALEASLARPWGIALDAGGRLYIVESEYGHIRRVDIATGIIANAAGTGSCCDSGDGGLATEADLWVAYGVAVDTKGNFYIAESGDDRIRKVDIATGIITTVAGGGPCCHLGDGGPATEANLYSPRGVAVDAEGNIYIADTFDNRVRKVDSATGIITTVAGNGTSGYGGDGGPATSANLNHPNAVALDAGGNLYIADTGNNRIRKVDDTGTITTVVGNGIFGFGGDGGPATDAELAYPDGLTFDSLGNLFITDSLNDRVRKVAELGVHPVAVLSSAGLDFPAQLVTTTSAGRTFELTNTGTAPLDITGIGITGANAGDFSQTNTCGSSLLTGATCDFTVTFQPSAAGSRSAAISITDSAAGSPRSIALTGQASDFALAAASGATCPADGNCSTSATVTAGESAVYNLHAAAMNGFAGAVALSCSGAPSLAACTISPSSVTLNGSPAAFTVTVSTTAFSLAAPPIDSRRLPPQTGFPLRLPSWLLFMGFFLLAAALIAATKKRKSALLPLLGLAAVLLIASWSTACTSGRAHPSPNHPGTPAGTSTLTITGTSAGVKRTTSLSLTVE